MLGFAKQCDVEDCVCQLSQWRMQGQRDQHHVFMADLIVPEGYRSTCTEPLNEALRASSTGKKSWKYIEYARLGQQS